MKHGETVGWDDGSESEYFVSLDAGDLGADALFQYLGHTSDACILFAGERGCNTSITKFILFSQHIL